MWRCSRLGWQEGQAIYDSIVTVGPSNHRTTASFCAHGRIIDGMESWGRTELRIRPIYACSIRKRASTAQTVGLPTGNGNVVFRAYTPSERIPELSSNGQLLLFFSNKKMTLSITMIASFLTGCRKCGQLSRSFICIHH